MRNFMSVCRFDDHRYMVVGAFIRLPRATTTVSSLAVDECMILVGWTNGAVHSVYLPCPHRSLACSLRDPQGSTTMAVALEGGVCAAALQNHVDVWDHGGSRRFCLGAPVSALCFHSEFLFVSAGLE